MKFAKVLNATLTTEWRSQYFQYEEAKEMLKDFFNNTIPAHDPDDIETLINTFENDFFEFTQRELEKADAFFREKINEAKPKLAQLSANLNEFLEHQRELEREKVIRETARPSAYAAIAHDDRPHTSLNIHDFELAYSEFYLGLILLQNYHHLNLTAFRKILKKHDKMLSSSRGARWREEVVLPSLFSTCKDVDQMLADVEREVTEKIANGDRKKAMKRLRVPPLDQPHHSPWTVFTVGIWMGIFAILVFIIAILVPWSLCDPKQPGCWQDACTPSNFTDPLAHDAPKFWEITIRIYRGIFLFSLMIILLGINVQGWAASGINHVLIFELDPRDHLSSLHLIEAGVALMTLSSASLAIWLCQFYLDYVFEISPLLIRYGVLAYLLLSLLFLLNPLPIFMYRSRIWLLKVLFRIITSPFSEVRFAEFWLADQFTSIVPVFQDFVFIICCCSIRFLPDGLEHTCDRHLFILTNIIGCLPAWFRFFQCLRRWYDSGKKHPHLTNAGKYSTTFFIVLFRSLHTAWDDGMIGPRTTVTTTQFSITTEFTLGNVTAPIAPQASTPTTTSYPLIFDVENPFFFCWIVAGTIGTLYTYVWDVKMDWGLLDSNASGENRFLRSYIIFQHRWYYYSAIIFDLLLRLSWTVTITDIRISQHNYITDIFITSLTFIEMFRRFIWNFFRLENEHVNNAGEFRAIRDISIKPIHADELDQQIKSPTKELKLPVPSTKDLLIPKKSSGRFVRVLSNCWRRCIPRKSDDQVPIVHYESCSSQASLIEEGNEDPSFRKSIAHRTRNRSRTADLDVFSTQVLESFYVTRRSKRESLVLK